jgi:hypothetical protein
MPLGVNYGIDATVPDDTYTLLRQVCQPPSSSVTVIYPWSEPIEVCYIIPYDGKKIIKVTSGMEDRVYFVPSFKAIIEKKGYSLKDILIIIHSHLGPEGFSGSDIILYRNLKRDGFKGVFLLKNSRGLFKLPEGIQ